MKLKNKTVLFLGDSITEGVGTSSADKTFSEIIRSLCHLKNAYNYGVGGTRIAKNKNVSKHTVWDYDFLTRASLMPRRADLIIVFGGTNDFGHGDAAIGSINSRSSYTFCGAVNNLISYLSGKYGKEKIIFFTPLHRHDENAEKNNYKTLDIPLFVYVEKIAEICKKRNVKCCNWFNDDDEDMQYLYNYCYADEVHINDEGHTILANKIIDFIKGIKEKK